MGEPPDRRKFLTCGLGGVLGLAVVGPAVSLVVAPARGRSVTSPTEPLDVGDAGMLGPTWRRVDVVAPEIRDAWVTQKNVVLGAAFIRKGQKVEALSAVCPHLGCPVSLEQDSFLCPCHNSRFGKNGEQGAGPARRGLDPLPIAVVDGRLRLTWVQYKLDTAARVKV